MRVLLCYTQISKPHVRNPNFGDEETKCLISLWGNPTVQRTLITSHKKSPIINTLAVLMQQRGYYRSPDEINTRLKNLKCCYNRIKKDLDGGILNNSKWLHFKAMDAILGKRWNKREVHKSYFNKDKEAILGSPKEKDLLEDNNDYEGTELRPEDLLEVEGPLDSVSIKEEDAIEEDLPNLGYQPTSPDRKSIQYLPGNKAVSIIPQISSSDTLCAQSKDSASASGNRISVVPTNFLLKSNSLYSQKKNEVSIIPAAPEPTFPSNNVQNGTLPLQVLLLNGLQKQQYNNNNNNNNNINSNSNNNNNKSDSKTCTQNIVDSDMSILLRQLIDIQSKALEIEKQKLDLKKQRLDYEQSIGSKLIMLIPLFETIARSIDLNNSKTSSDDTIRDSINN
ncbi:probable serine/threonine-protein kinase DDB_G0267686 isoform X2 [Ctenocephalides felis]|uniref:probable serine/threonine-protein kinase DDB_G0267686 isoform X2 n=1 Tax=Ctenocephalides felis TaxID=7515 RepID=UPI000E6E2BBE|nr:probable serine/threonine-protein kinase DDB_G0267686 isoform X2 [Ctenocephalides felis]